MRLIVLCASVVLLAAQPAAAQVTEAVLRETIREAEAEPTANNLLQAANAARLLRDFEQSEALYEQAWQSTFGVLFGVISGAILDQLASGGGEGGALREFREIRQNINLPPITIANLANNFPTLLVGGEFDDMILSFSPDHPDPQYRCACFAQKAWVHRVAGRMGDSRAYWDSLIVAQDQNAAPAPSSRNAAADLRAQRARNLARAGRAAEARDVLDEAMAMEVSDAALPGIRRRWAQAMAELGDVEGVVAQLEPLLSVPSLVTVQSLETRMTWRPLRDHPAFQAMLDRHR